jgi:peptidoglycan hydrolase-like protein with peptidoglycan-binding domain
MRPIMEFQRELAFRFPLTRGDDVTAVQLALTALSVTPPCGTIDGIYGHATEQAVAAFQQAQRLAVDGAVGPGTWRELFRKAASRQAPSAVLGTAAKALPADDLPLKREQALQAQRWMMEQFGPTIEEAVHGTAMTPDLVCAIACKETASVWLHWIERLPPPEVLARCVFDASGDMPGHPRNAFPRTTAQFRERYGALTDELIAEANLTRQLREIPSRPWLYKGYGIFQYDLQHIEQGDEAFFRNRLWYRFDECLKRLMLVLKDKLELAHGDLEQAVGLYNGSGARADLYRRQVLAIRDWLAAPAPAGAGNVGGLDSSLSPPQVGP